MSPPVWQLLRGSHTDSVINASALDYLRAQRLPQMFLAALQQGPQRFDDGAAWNAHLQALGILREQAHAAMLKAALSHPGVRDVMQVYGNWREKDRGLDAYRLATKEPAIVTTTNFSNHR